MISVQLALKTNFNWPGRVESDLGDVLDCRGGERRMPPLQGGRRLGDARSRVLLASHVHATDGPYVAVAADGLGSQPATLASIPDWHL
eukprot:7963339-Pyramimonas_sp.AAC.1